MIVVITSHSTWPQNVRARAKDNRLILWSDGDTWIRVEAHADLAKASRGNRYGRLSCIYIYIYGRCSQRKHALFATRRSLTNHLESVDSETPGKAVES